MSAMVTKGMSVHSACGRLCLHVSVSTNMRDVGATQVLLWFRLAVNSQAVLLVLLLFPIHAVNYAVSGACKGC